MVKIFFSFYFMLYICKKIKPWRAILLQFFSDEWYMFLYLRTCGWTIYRRDVYTHMYWCVWLCLHSTYRYIFSTKLYPNITQHHIARIYSILITISFYRWVCCFFLHFVHGKLFPRVCRSMKGNRWIGHSMFNRVAV